MTNKYLEKIAEWQKDPDYMDKRMKYGLIGSALAPVVGTLIGAGLGHRKEKQINREIDSLNDNKSPKGTKTRPEIRWRDRN